MMNKRAFSLVELLVSMVIAAIFVLMVGEISRMSMKTSKRVREKTQIHADLAYAMKMIRNRVRSGDTITTAAQASPWLSQRLIVDDAAFGVYQQSAGKNRELIYLEDKDSGNIEADKDVLFYVPSTGTLNMTVSVTGGTYADISVSGTKYATTVNSMPFSMSTEVERRVE